MKRLLLSAACATAMSLAIAQEAAAPVAVSQADFAALMERVAQLEAVSKAQAARIAELESQNTALAAAQEAAKKDIADVREAAKKDVEEATELKFDETTEVSESGRVITTETGNKYYLADTTARIFEPLSESGLRITPYGYLTFEAVHNTQKTEVDIYSDWVLPRSRDRRNSGHQTSFSMNDSILGFNFDAPELQNGWKMYGKFEFDLAGDHANDPAFHFRHLYFAMDNEQSGWNILFGQTWHLWKMVTPNEIDGAWLEQCCHPYRRSPQVRVTKKFTFDDDSTLELRAGIVKNGNGMGGDRDDDDNQDNSASAWALIEGAVVYERKAAWEDSGRKWLVGLGGMYGRDRSHRPTAVNVQGEFTAWDGDLDEYNTDMVMLAAQVPFLEKLTFTGQIFAGENLGGVQAGIGQRVGFSDINKKGREVSTVGGFADLRYDLNDTWAFSAGYGFDDPVDSEAKDADGRIFNGRAYLAAFYQFNANLHFGVEYAHLTTKYYGDGTADDERFQFTAFYDF